MRGRIHGHRGHSTMDVRQRLPRSVVNYLTKSTPSLRSRNKSASVGDNTSFIDNFFNSQSRMETFRVMKKKKAWTNHGFMQVKMSNIRAEANASSNIPSSADMDMVGLHVIGQKTNRYKRSNPWKRKFRLKNRKKHNELIRKCIKDSKGTLTVADVIPLHKLWSKYAKGVMVESKCASNDATKNQLMNVDSSKFNNAVSKIDLHGCLIKIIKCKSRPHHVDCEGIIVLVSKNRFVVITTLPKKDKLIVVPFKDTAFTFELCHRVVTIYGDHYRQFIS